MAETSRAETTSPERPPASPQEADGPHFSPFTRRVAVAVGFTALVVVLLLFVWMLAQVLLLLFAGLLLAVFLNGMARRIQAHTPLTYGWALAATCMGLVAVWGVIGWLLAPAVVTQLSELTDTLPQSIERLHQELGDTRWGGFLLEQLPAPEQIVSGRQGIWTQVTGAVSMVVGMLANALVILVTGLFLAANPAQYRRGLVRLVPMSRRNRADEVLGSVGKALWGWLIGQFVAMTLVGLLTWIGLMLLGVPLALGLGVIAGAFEFVPYIGPWVSAVPAVLIALLSSPQQALYVSLLFLGIQQLEGNLITPLVMKEAVSLPPALTIAATVVAVVLFGLAGVLLATPLLVVVKVLVQKLYIEDVLGDKPAHDKA